MKSIFLALVALLVFTSCAGRDPNLTPSGKAKPVVTVDFPAEAHPGAEHEAVVEITNPGPGDMRTVVIAFATIAPRQGSQEFPNPIVGIGTGGDNPSVVSVEPEPSGVSPDGVIYTFGGSGSEPRLAEGASMTVTFTLKVPVIAGVAANSVQVYDGDDVDRVAGVRMETLVGR